MSSALAYLSVNEAQRQVAAHMAPGPLVRVPLREALGRVAAAPIVCDMDFPPFDRALMDGYAVRLEDLARSQAENAKGPANLKVVGQVAAGGEAGVRLNAGEAVQINTGAPVPPGSNAVVPIELAERADQGDWIAIQGEMTPGQYIDSRGKYVRAGSIVIQPGTRLRPAHIAVAASVGAAEVVVYRQPRVAILVTGDELVEVARVPRGTEIRDGNGPMLEALVCGAHAAPWRLGVVGDDKGLLCPAVRRGFDADLLCISGGVSMGAFDFVPQVLAECGVRTLVRKMRLKPGKPTTFGLAESGTGVFALAGNPIGCFVGFWLLVRGAIEALEGRHGVHPAPIAARLAGRCSPTGDRETYLPARVRVDEHGGLTAERLSWHGSGDPFGFCDAEALIVRHPGAGGAENGDTVSIILLDEPRG